MFTISNIWLIFVLFWKLEYSEHLPAINLQLMKKWARLLLQLGFHPKKSKIKSLKSVTFKTGGYEINRSANGRTKVILVLSCQNRHMWHQFLTIRHHFSCFDEKCHFLRNQTWRFGKSSFSQKLMLWIPETLCPVHFSNYSKRYMHLNFIFQRNKRKWCDSFVAEYIYYSFI